MTTSVPVSGRFLIQRSYGMKRHAFYQRKYYLPTVQRAGVNSCRDYIISSVR